MTNKGFEEKPYSCPFCAKRYAAKRSIQEHIEFIHERQKDKKHVCSTCNKKFSNKRGLQKHILAFHKR